MQELVLAIDGMKDAIDVCKVAGAIIGVTGREGIDARVNLPQRSASIKTNNPDVTKESLIEAIKVAGFAAH